MDLPQGNYRLTASLPNDVDQQTYRIDQNLGKFGTVFARGTKSNYSVTTVGNIATNPSIGQNFFVEDTTNWAVSHTLTIGPSMVNQFRFGYLEATANQGGYPADPADISALGLTGVFTNLSDPQRVYPSVSLSNGFSGVGGAVNAYTASNQPMWEFADSFTWVRGNHTIGIGAEYRQWKLERDLADNFLGNFNFNGFATSPASLASPTSDNVVADMLLGYYSTAAVFQPGGFSSGSVAGNPRTFNLKYFAPYIQDDWKVSPRLTLNLGVRWDFRTVPYETNNHMGWLDVTNPSGGLCMADKTLITKGIIGDGTYYRYCGRTTPADPSYMPFAPRIGFAYRPFGGDKTVIRGGYGVFWDSAELRETDGSADLYPYVSRGNYIQSPGQATPLQTTNTLFPQIVQGPAVPADNTFIAVIISEHPRNPYVQQWSFSIQRQLNSRTTLEVNYIGNKGTHLLERRNINQAYPPADPANPAPLEARRPYQNFVTYINSDWSGNSSYNSANVTLQHRSGPLGLTAVYTWAKAIDEKSAAAGIGSTGSGYQGFMDNHDARRDRGLADFDVDHRFVGSFIYDLPFGRGKRFLSSTPKAVDVALGNWQVNGIATFQRGFPYSITAPDLGNVLDTNGAQRGSVIGQAYPSGFTQSIAEWFNTAAFVQPPAGVFGNTGRNILRAPGINSWNLSLFKNFPIKERVNLQLRLESFNAFNHPQWGVPTNDVSSPQFGQITSTNIPGRIIQLGGKLTCNVQVDPAGIPECRVPARSRSLSSRCVCPNLVSMRKLCPDSTRGSHSADQALKRMSGLQLIRAYSGLQQDSKAVETALVLNRTFPKDPEILYHTSRIYANFAYLNLRDLADAAPDSIWRHQAAGEAYESAGNFDLAISEYRKVLALDPGRRGIDYRIGRVLLSRARSGDSGSQTEALKEFEKELASDPTNANAAYEAGEIYRKSGQVEKARDLFAKAVDHYPEFLK